VETRLKVRRRTIGPLAAATDRSERYDRRSVRRARRDATQRGRPARPALRHGRADRCCGFAVRRGMRSESLPHHRQRPQPRRRDASNRCNSGVPATSYEYDHNTHRRWNDLFFVCFSRKASARDRRNQRRRYPTGGPHRDDRPRTTSHDRGTTSDPRSCGIRVGRTSDVASNLVRTRLLLRWARRQLEQPGAFESGLKQQRNVSSAR